MPAVPDPDVQRKRMLIALAVLLVALVAVVLKDWDFWFPSTDDAQELAKVIKEGLDQAMGLAALLAAQNKEMAPLVDTVKNLHVDTKGSTITITSEVSEDLIEKSFKKN